MTNADVIRNMTDEELFEFLSEWECGDIDYSITFCDLCINDKINGGEGNELGLDCDGCRKHWLTRDASEYDGLNYWKEKAVADVPFDRDASFLNRDEDNTHFIMPGAGEFFPKTKDSEISHGRSCEMEGENEMKSMFSDDMTFCMADCENKKDCFRNPELIIEPQYPHSYSDFSEVCNDFKPKEN